MEKVYIIVRKEILTIQQCAVQASHAVAELVHKYDVKNWVENDKTIVILNGT